jgi:CheY-like chemotaxis protein
MSGELVIIIDDNAANREQVRDVLQGHGYDTLEASTAEEGIPLVKARRPDLVLMDIQLLGVDGLEALRRLRIYPQTAHIRVVALTAYAMPGDRERLIDAGFDGYVTKPISIKPFLQQVQLFCSGEV